MNAPSHMRKAHPDGAMFFCGSEGWSLKGVEGGVESMVRVTPGGATSRPDRG